MSDIKNTEEEQKINSKALGDIGIAGKGTKASPWEIASQGDLDTINGMLEANNGFAGQYFKLTGDITLDSTWKGLGNVTITSAQTNSPYVESGTGFAGEFDGNGKTITVNRTESNTNGVGGLINYLEPEGHLHDLEVKGTIKVDYTEEPDFDNLVEGLSAVGGAVAYNSGIIDKVKSSVTITCADYVYDIGGIAGFNDNLYMDGAIGLIQNSSNSGSVAGYERVGGIAGENAGLIASCSNSGQIITNSRRKSGTGGIAGRNGNNNTAVETGAIRNCYNTGTIESGEKSDKNTWGSWLGGIAGFQNSLSAAANGYDTGNLHWGESYSGYIIGCSNNTGADRGAGNFYYPDNIDSEGMAQGDGEKHNEEQTINGTALEESQMQLETFADTLNVGNTKYGTWEGNTDNYPTLENKANARGEITAAKGWEYEEKHIYLNPAAAANGCGTEDDPFNNLNDAVNAAGIGFVHLMGTVTITDGVTMYESTTFLRYNPDEFTGPMFLIDAPDTDYDGNGTSEITYVTIEGAIVDGGGVGTLYQVEQGRLRLRGSSVLQNADIGVEVKAKTLTGDKKAQAQLELNEALITTSLAVKMEGATVGDGSGSADTNNLILDSFGTYEVRVKGAVYLAKGAYMTAGYQITCPVTIECEEPATGRKVIVGLKGEKPYALTVSDMNNIRYVGNACDMALNTADNEIIMDECRIYYLDGGRAENGDGTLERPFNSLRNALDGVGGNSLILVTGTTSVSSGTYSENVTIQRTAGFAGTMFKLTNPEEDVIFSKMILLGRSVGAGVTPGMIVHVDTGTLMLDGGVTLSGAETAIEISLDGTVRIQDAVISAAQYSIELDSINSRFYLDAADTTSITEPVYLINSEGSSNVGPYISVEKAIPCEIEVECKTPGMNVVVAMGSNGYRLTQTDAGKVSCKNVGFGIVLNTRFNNLSLIEE